MNKLDELQILIAKSNDVDFSPFGFGTTDDWIIKAEERLSFEFPESYKWWLKNYGGGEIFGEEIFSIYELDFDNVIGGDVVYINELNRKNGVTTPEQLTICEGEFGMFYFQRIENQKECPVFLNGNYYAKDFIEFLIKRITQV